MAREARGIGAGSALSPDDRTLLSHPVGAIIMSYCRWSDGDLYAYRTEEEYQVHVAARRVTSVVRQLYVEPTAAALLGRILWLGSKGCDYPWDALRYLKEDIIAEIEELEGASQRSR